MPSNTFFGPAGSGNWGLSKLVGSGDYTGPSAIPARGNTGTITGGANDASTIWNVKNPALEERLNQYLGAYDDTQTKNNADLGAFKDLFDAYTPRIEGIMNQENGAIGDAYNGNAKKELDRLAATRNNAVRNVAGLALQEARRGQSMRGLNGAASGSYTNAQAMQNATGIYTKAALDSANQDRANYEYLNNLKYGLLGKRTAALNDFANRSLTPYNLRNANMNNAQSQLGFYNAQDKTNTFYGVGAQTNPVAPNSQFYFDPTARGYGL